MRDEDLVAFALLVFCVFDLDSPDASVGKPTIKVPIIPAIATAAAKPSP